MSSQPSIAKILAANLGAALAASGLSQRQLAAKAKVAQTSIGYMLKPETRTPTKSGKLPSPTISAIQKVATALGIQAWQLLYPNHDLFEISEKERELWNALEADMQQLRALHETQGKYVVKGKLSQ